MSENYFSQLNSINVNDKTEKKNGLTYLSWAWAWGEVKKLYPDAIYTIYENELGWCYHTDGRTCWVKTGVTINGIEHIEYLPIMDYKNRSIAADAVTSFDVNKAIQRSLTKAVARHGLGLYIYAGEDLPEGEEKKDEYPKGDEFKPYVRTPKDAKEAGALVITTGKYPNKTLKQIWKTDKAYFEELGSTGDVLIKTAIELMKKALSEQNESKLNSKDQKSYSVIFNGQANTCP